MSVRIGFTQQSIQNTTNAFNNIAKDIETKILDDFYYKCYLFFVEKCRNYLNSSSIGNEVKKEINIGWDYERTATGVKFTNKAEKAVYVEFGVGMVGEENYHTNAKKLGNNYQYSIGSKIKDDGTWIFNVTEETKIDIQQGFILNKTEHTVRTKGSPAVMYAFQALDELRLAMPTIWEEIKVKYWG